MRAGCYEAGNVSRGARLGGLLCNGWNDQPQKENHELEKSVSKQHTQAFNAARAIPVHQAEEIRQQIVALRVRKASSRAACRYCGTWYRRIGKSIGTAIKAVVHQSMLVD